ncbi:MAG: type III pantothenate kinase [Alphaproteobacteria bacterium]|uniref:Type III pantothenate kinase n=1 Tax=Candidatus Nitrobium versatile TaxID=2884831 RepID=A0A953J9G2_9BACT|nr:type III pantothenate kinase [Candidatus Nitrobium versatile]
MLLGIDIGNTTIGLGLFPEPEGGTELFVRKIPSHPARPAEYYKREIIALLGQGGISTAPSVINQGDAILSSVVPPLTRPVLKAARELTGRKPLIVSHALQGGLLFEVKHPDQVGADRIATAVAGAHRYNRPVAVGDFGTATTITVVGPRLRFLGGAIMPGLHLMQHALFSRTAQLPSVVLDRAQGALGKDTRSAIASGILYGTAGGVESLVKSMEKELAFKVQLVLTGGYASLLSSFIRRKHEVVPHLLFEGLRLIYLKTKGTEIWK